jgi:phosphate transport system permease protein
LDDLVDYSKFLPFENQIELAWTASLVLVLIVLMFNILARLFGQPKV